MTTETELRKGFLLGSWEVLPDRGLLRDGRNREHLEPLVMRVLVALAADQGEVLSKDALIERVWDGRALSDEPLNRCISILRRKLGDDSRDPKYIQNIPRLGYRLMMPVTLAATPATAAPAAQQVRTRFAWMWGSLAVALTAALVFSVQYWIAGGARAKMQSIAIYPFVCADGAEEYLCFGFSEELTSTLLQTSQVKIVKLREPLSADADVTSIAAALDVDGLLTGGVQRIGDRLKISAEMIDGKNGFVVLSDTVDGAVADVFGLQEQVASMVANTLFGASGEPIRSRSRPGNFAAFERYARGQYQFERRSRESIEASIRLFQQTIELDAMFGPAYLRLAYAYLLLPEYDASLSIQEMYDRAADTAQAGIAADPGIEEIAGTVFGFIHHKRGEWAAAAAAFETAINADTVFPVTRNWYSKFLATTGQLEEARLQAQLAYEQAPDNATIVSRLAITNLWLGDVDAAGRYFDIANGLGQESPIHDLAYALYLVRSKDIDAASRFTKTGLQKYGAESDWVDTVFGGLADPAKRSQAVATLQYLEADGRVARYIVVTLWAVLGEPQRALATLESIDGIGQDFETGFEVLFSDDLRELRVQDGFGELLEAHGLQQYWAQTGCDWSNDRLRCRP